VFNDSVLNNCFYITKRNIIVIVIQGDLNILQLNVVERQWMV